MEIEDVYQDFLLLKEFKSPDKIKKKMLKELLETTENPWRVIGITKSALLLFKENDFKLKFKGKNLPIQRAHLNDRDVWYTDLFQKEFQNHIDWYDFICKNDNTILALSTENKKINEIDYILFDENSIKLSFFKSTRISWKHSERERNFLKMIYKNITNL